MARKIPTFRFRFEKFYEVDEIIADEVPQFGQIF